MGDSQVVVSMGKDKVTIAYASGMTFGDLRGQVAEKLGEDGSTFRLLCKGRSVKDSDAVCSTEPPASIKVMALRTKKYHDAQKGGSSAQRARGPGPGYHDAIEEAQGKERKVQIETSRPSAPRGDKIEEAENYVVVRVLRERYHVKTEAAMSVLDLKTRLAGMDGVDVRATDMRLIYSGREVKDSDTMVGLGVRRGSMFLLMRGAAHHEAKEAAAELGAMRTAVIRLETRAKKLQRERARRLVDDAEFQARLGELTQEAIVHNLKLTRIKSDNEDAMKQVSKSLERLDELLEQLRTEV